MPTITSEAEVLIRLLAIILCNFLSEESSGWEPKHADVMWARVMHILCVNGDNISWQYKLIIIPLTVQILFSIQLSWLQLSWLHT